MSVNVPVNLPPQLDGTGREMRAASKAGGQNFEIGLERGRPIFLPHSAGFFVERFRESAKRSSIPPPTVDSVRDRNVCALKMVLQNPARYAKVEPSTIGRTTRGPGAGGVD